MRRAFALLFIALAAPAAALAGGTEVSFRATTFSYDDLVPGYCAFPIRFVGSQEHWQKFQYMNLPDGMHIGDPGAGIYQVAGWHFASTREVVSNPANGRSANVVGEDNLARRDFEFHFTYDALWRATGYFTAIDHISYNYTITAPGGLVYKDTGHQRREHTSFIVNGRRVGRIDDPFFTKGIYRDRLCEYLAG